MTIKDTPKTRDIERILRVVFYLAAAREDATPDQLQQLGTHVVPVVRANLRKGGNLTLIPVAVRLVMPPSWGPQGEWAEAIAHPLAHPIVLKTAQERGLDLQKLLG